jgi:hypothetical protein
MIRIQFSGGNLISNKFQEASFYMPHVMNYFFIIGGLPAVNLPIIHSHSQNKITSYV